jgi:hypothetical protein
VSVSVADDIDANAVGGTALLRQGVSSPPPTSRLTLAFTGAIDVGQTGQTGNVEVTAN